MVYKGKWHLSKGYVNFTTGGAKPVLQEAANNTLMSVCLAFCKCLQRNALPLWQFLVCAGQYVPDDISRYGFDGWNTEGPLGMRGMRAGAMRHQGVLPVCQRPFLISQYDPLLPLLIRRLLLTCVLAWAAGLDGLGGGFANNDGRSTTDSIE